MILGPLALEALMHSASEQASISIYASCTGFM
jgi:hypothetical protein